MRCTYAMTVRRSSAVSLAEDTDITVDIGFDWHSTLLDIILFHLPEPCATQADSLHHDS